MAKTRALQIEQDILKDMGATPHANSGAMKKKHDGSTRDFLIEVKTTTNKSFSINREYWEKLQERALSMHKDPVMVIAFDDGISPSLLLRTVVVMDYEDFQSGYLPMKGWGNG